MTTTWQRHVKATLYQKNYESSSLWSKMEIEKRKNGLKILPSIVLLKALELSKDVKYNISEGDFKARNHWCQRFMKRKNLSLRQKTTLAQRLPDDYEEKIVRFHCFIIDRRKEKGYPLHFIANMDETPLTFNMPPNRTTRVRKLSKCEELICSWISQAWSDIPVEMITASFLKCGIQTI